MIAAPPGPLLPFVNGNTGVGNISLSGKTGLTPDYFDNDITAFNAYNIQTITDLSVYNLIAKNTTTNINEFVGNLTGTLVLHGVTYGFAVINISSSSTVDLINYYLQLA